MKKIIAVAALLITISTVYAQPFTKTISAATGETGKTVTRVPAAVLASYNAMYPGATTIKWTWKDHTFYQVIFTFKGEKMSASYLTDGSYVGK